MTKVELYFRLNSSPQVVYVTATLPYLFLIIMFIKGLTLDGAMDGLNAFLAPDFSRLLSVQVKGFRHILKNSFTTQIAVQ